MTRKQFMLVFLAPPVAILLFLAFYPLFNAFAISLQDWDLRHSVPRTFVGFDNYVKLFSDARFLNALKISFFWLVLTLGGSVLIGMILAPIIHHFTRGRFRQLCLFVFVIPVILPRVGAAYMWRLMYSPGISILNYLLSLVGIKPVNWLSDPRIALYSVAIIDVWQWAFLIAALLVILLDDVPRETIEAGLMDGANTLQTYLYILFPVIMPVSIPIFFIKMMESLRSFDFIFVLTAGGPGTATETLDMYAYWQGIGSAGRVSYASAMSIFMMILTIILVNSTWKTVEKWQR